MTLAFCEKLSVAHNREMGLVSMKVLWTLYQSLGGDSATRYHVYYYLVSLANKSTVYTDMASTRNMFKQFQPLLSTEQYQAVPVQYFLVQ